MSAATGSVTEIVHVRLQDEGVEVWRPVRARKLASGAYELASDPAPPDERWEFSPGEHVSVADRELAGGPATIAVSRFGHRGTRVGRH